jgi:hypothetical protein
MMPTTDPLHPDRLKDKQRALRDGFSLPLTLRVHRALSWLLRAHREDDNLDTRFIHLWIGFNAAYAGDLERALEDDDTTERRKVSGNERERFESFFRTLVMLDGEGRLYKALWDRFPQEIRILLDRFGIFTVHRTGLSSGACVRVTPALFNSMAELDALADALSMISSA